MTKRLEVSSRRASFRGLPLIAVLLFHFAAALVPRNLVDRIVPGVINSGQTSADRFGDGFIDL